MQAGIPSTPGRGLVLVRGRLEWLHSQRCEPSFFYIYIHSPSLAWPPPPPRPHLWKNCLPRNRSLVPKMLRITGLKGRLRGCHQEGQAGIRGLGGQGNEHSHDLFLTVLVRYRSHIIQFTHLKCVQWFWHIHNHLQLSASSAAEHLHHPTREAHTC